jgi:hypothetical protein
MPHMNGFELSEKILATDLNVKVCFMSSVEINREALREIYPALSLGCLIRKPITMDRIGLDIDVVGNVMDYAVTYLCFEE